MDSLPGPEPPTPQAIRGDAADRADRAWRLRVAGASWPQVAQMVGFSDSSAAQRAVRNCYGDLPAVDKATLRALWRDRLEALWRQVMKDATEQRPGATTSGVRVAQAAASLDGLNEPVRVDVVTPSQQEMFAFVEAVLTASGKQPQVAEYDIISGEIVAQPD